jgi:hypothetical protein
MPDLKNRWILDCRSSVHIYNNKGWFETITPYQTELATSNLITKGKGIRTVRLAIRDPQTGKQRIIRLTNALYVLGCHTNLVSYTKMRRLSVKWCQDTDTIVDPNNLQIAKLQLVDLDLWVFDLPSHNSVNTITRKSERPQKAKGSIELWHRRLAHINIDTIKQAKQMVDGIEITEDNKDKEVNSPYRVYNLVRAPRQISRRLIRRTFRRFRRIHFDLIQIQPAENRHR